MFEKLLKYIRAIPKRKHYLEFLTATLSVPVLATAILINIGNLKAEDNKKDTPPERVIVTYAPNNEKKSEKDDEKTTPKENEVCKKAIGPVSIASPTEGDIVTDNPFTVRIDYETGEYCAAVWSYRINNGKWSEYDDTSFSVYNLPNGKKILEVRVKSIASNDEKTLKRAFDYQGTETPVSPTTTIDVSPAQ